MMKNMYSSLITANGHRRPNLSHLMKEISYYAGMWLKRRMDETFRDKRVMTDLPRPETSPTPHMKIWKRNCVSQHSPHSPQCLCECVRASILAFFSFLICIETPDRDSQYNAASPSNTFLQELYRRDWLSDFKCLCGLRDLIKASNIDEKMLPESPVSSEGV